MTTTRSRREHLRGGLLVALAGALAACGPVGEALPTPAPFWDLGDTEDEDDSEAPTPAMCDGAPGDPRIELIANNEDHVPLEDGAAYGVARRPQGEVTIIAAVWWGGLDGGDTIHDFLMTFVDPAGDLLGARSTATFVLPCEPDGTVGAHWFELYMGSPATPPEAWEGVEGRLTVSFLTEDDVLVEDAIDASLYAEESE